MRLLGVDEAGRGPVLGPMVVAGVVSYDQEALRTLGVRDSKRLSPQRRLELARDIERHGECRVLVVPAKELDIRMECASLNQVEAECFAEIIRALAPDEAWVDCCDTSEARFKSSILRFLGYSVPLRAEHGADDRYPIVSAASIMAKVRRDEELALISEELGRAIGSGYAHDPRTISFLETYVREWGEMPPHTRRGWQTSRNILSRACLRSLAEWD